MGLRKCKSIEDFCGVYANKIYAIRTSSRGLLYTLSGQPMQYSKKHRKVTEEKINAVRKLYQNTDDVIEFALNNYKRISLG